MWKKIGIRSDSPGDSGVRSYQRIRALDQKQVIERDNSTGKLSASSSKMSKSGSQASHTLKGTSQIQQKISLFYGQNNHQLPLTPKAIFGMSPKGENNEITFQQMATKLSSGSSPPFGQSFQKSIRHPDQRFFDSKDHPNESQFVKESSASFVDDLQLLPLTTNSRMMQDYIERLQQSLKASRKANHIYESKLKQAKFQMNQMKKQVRKQLQNFKTQIKSTTRTISSRLDANIPSQLLIDPIESRQPTERTITEAGQQDNDLNIIFNKIEEIREDLRGSSDLKKNIISRLDDNLKRLGDARRHRAKIII